jgi:hypothetical protein
MLKSKLRKEMPFADGAVINKLFRKDILALLGEETEEDK